MPSPETNPSPTPNTDYSPDWVFYSEEVNAEVPTAEQGLVPYGEPVQAGAPPVEHGAVPYVEHDYSDTYGDEREAVPEPEASDPHHNASNDRETLRAIENMLGHIVTNGVKINQPETESQSSEAGADAETAEDEAMGKPMTERDAEEVDPDSVTSEQLDRYPDRPKIKRNTPEEEEQQLQDARLAVENASRDIVQKLLKEKEEREKQVEIAEGIRQPDAPLPPLTAEEIRYEQAASIIEHRSIDPRARPDTRKQRRHMDRLERRVRKLQQAEHRAHDRAITIGENPNKGMPYFAPGHAPEDKKERESDIDKPKAMKQRLSQGYMPHEVKGQLRTSRRYHGALREAEEIRAEMEALRDGKGPGSVFTRAKNRLRRAWDQR